MEAVRVTFEDQTDDQSDPQGVFTITQGNIKAAMQVAVSEIAEIQSQGLADGKPSEVLFEDSNGSTSIIIRIQHVRFHISRMTSDMELFVPLEACLPAFKEFATWHANLNVMPVIIDDMVTTEANFDGDTLLIRWLVPPYQQPYANLCQIKLDDCLASASDNQGHPVMLEVLGRRNSMGSFKPVRFEIKGEDFLMTTNYQKKNYKIQGGDCWVFDAEICKPAFEAIYEALHRE